MSIPLDTKALNQLMLEHDIQSADLSVLSGVNNKTVDDAVAGRWGAAKRSTVEALANALDVEPWRIIRPAPNPAGFSRVHGGKVALLRGRRNLSQTALAAFTGETQRSISDIETGTRKSFKPGQIERLASGLGVDIASIGRAATRPENGSALVTPKPENPPPVSSNAEPPHASPEMTASELLRLTALTTDRDAIRAIKGLAIDLIQGVTS